MNNNINTLRNELFDTLSKLKKREITIDEAKAVCDVGQTIINTAKVEVDYLKASGSTYHKNNFIDAPSENVEVEPETLKNTSIFRLAGGRQ